MKDVGPKDPRGRKPYIFDALPIEDIIPIMILDAMQGGLFEELPGTIYEKTNHLMGLDTLRSIKDPLFTEAKSVANALSMKYWKNQMQMATIPASIYIWYTRNKFGFRNGESIELNLGEIKQETEQEKLERRAQLQLMLREVAGR